MRWIGRELTEGVGLILEGKYSFSYSAYLLLGADVYTNEIVCCCLVAGGVGTLRYVPRL